MNQETEESRLPSPVWVGLVPPAGGLTRTERWKKEQVTLSACVQAGTWPFCTPAGTSPPDLH